MPYARYRPLPPFGLSGLHNTRCISFASGRAVTIEVTGDLAAVKRDVSPGGWDFFPPQCESFTRRREPRMQAGAQARITHGFDNRL